MTVAIRATDLVKSYTPGQRALSMASPWRSPGEVLVVMGPSFRKSTLIWTFNGLESLNGGQLDVLGIPLMLLRPTASERDSSSRWNGVSRSSIFPTSSVVENITLRQ